MGSHPRNQQGGGAAAPTKAAPAAPKLVNNQIPAELRGATGGAWTPQQTQAGGRWEVPAGAPAGAIGRNWVPMSAPAAPADSRDQLARLQAQMDVMRNSPTDSRRGYPVSEGGYRNWR